MHPSHLASWIALNWSLGRGAIMSNLGLGSDGRAKSQVSTDRDIWRFNDRADLSAIHELGVRAAYPS